MYVSEMLEPFQGLLVVLDSQYNLHASVLLSLQVIECHHYYRIVYFSSRYVCT